MALKPLAGAARAALYGTWAAVGGTPVKPILWEEIIKGEEGRTAAGTALARQVDPHRRDKNCGKCDSEGSDG
jgi:hypothetical protein